MNYSDHSPSHFHVRYGEQGFYASLKEHDRFAQVHVNPDLGTIYWPNGANLDPDVLNASVTGEPLPSMEQPTTILSSDR